MAEKLSKKLNETLSEKDRSAVESLFNVSNKLEQFFSYAECSREERETIADKELNIMYLVEQIGKIKERFENIYITKIYHKNAKKLYL